MAEKLSWTELRRLVAKRAGVSEKEANAFLSALIAQLVEALKTEKQVKINGLGTFKLQAVAPRKSVHVTTGEEITIEGYNKLAFVPEAGVKELVEKGERRKEPGEGVSEVIDPLQKLGAQADEIVDILGELGQSPEEKPAEPVVEEPKEDAPLQEEAIEEPEPVVEEPVVEEPIVEEPVVEEPVVEEPVVEEPKQPKKEYHFVRDTLICVVILLLLLLIGYFFLRNELSNWIESLVQPKQTEYTVQPTEAEEPEAVAYEEEVEIEEEVAESAAEPEEWTYKEFLLTEKITDGSRLAWIAKKHYGNKDLWPHLYAANKERIDNPSKITVGTPIRVPKLTAEQRDMTDERFIRLKEEAERAIR